MLTLMSSSPGFTTVDLRSRRMSVTCGEESFRFTWRCLGREEEAHLSSRDVLGVDDESKFYEIRQKADEKAAATGAAMPGELQLMATIGGGLSCSRFYGARSEATQLRAESSRIEAGLPLCYLDARHRIMRRVEAIVSSVCAAFDEHIRRFVEQSYLLYTPMPPMIDIVRAAMGTVPSTCSSMAIVVGTSHARVSSSTPPRSFTDAPTTNIVDPSPSL
ncbi:hypothetical protein M9H77_34035 [Catharanthus roseus]|uniref:Uncharacterized protein n=1 Tax=Catharanthus roseus TaxID=4058 RepID=A0ACB9ZKS0_CATRO|nr:hypothetical protein M9H77_34035 [Catharanthus roseus]